MNSSDVSVSSYGDCSIFRYHGRSAARLQLGAGKTARQRTCGRRLQHDTEKQDNLLCVVRIQAAAGAGRADPNAEYTVDSSDGRPRLSRIMHGRCPCKRWRRRLWPAVNAPSAASSQRRTICSCQPRGELKQRRGTGTRETARGSIEQCYSSSRSCGDAIRGQPPLWRHSIRGTSRTRTANTAYATAATSAGVGCPRLSVLFEEPVADLLGSDGVTLCDLGPRGSRFRQPWHTAHGQLETVHAATRRLLSGTRRLDYSTAHPETTVAVQHREHNRSL